MHHHTEATFCNLCKILVNPCARTMHISSKCVTENTTASMTELTTPLKLSCKPDMEFPFQMISHSLSYPILPFPDP